MNSYFKYLLMMILMLTNVSVTQQVKTDWGCYDNGEGNGSYVMSRQNGEYIECFSSRFENGDCIWTDKDSCTINSILQNLYPRQTITRFYSLCNKGVWAPWAHKTHETSFRMNVVYDKPFCSLEEFDVLNNNTGGSILSIRNSENVVINSLNQLELRVLNFSATAKPYSSGYVSLKEAHGHGYYECTMMYAQANGINNACWLTSDGYTFTNVSGVTVYRTDEIDINEGKWNNVFHAGLHQWYPRSDGPWGHLGLLSLRRNIKGVDFTRTWNTFGFFFSETKLNWYMNGNLMNSMSNNPANIHHIPPVAKLNFRLSNAVGSFAGSVRSTVIGKTTVIKSIKIILI